LHYAINFLKANAGIESPALLSSPFLLISLGYFGHQSKYTLDAQQAAELRYWLYVANAKGRYSRGSSETLLDQDLARIRDGKGVSGLIETLEQQFGRLDISPADLERRNARSAYFKTMFLAFRRDGAKDWTSNLTISLSQSGKQHRLQFHHVFARALLKREHKPVLVNDIANLAFIGGKTNRRISAKPPAEYLPKIDNAARAAQCIPDHDALLTVENYPQFLAERRTLIAARLNRFLEDSPCVLLLLHWIGPLCYRFLAVVSGFHSGGCVMEGRSWTICRGFVVRIPSAPTTGNAGAKTCRYAVAMGRTNSGGCSAAGPAGRGFRSARGRRCSARPCRRKKSARSWSTSRKAAASARPAAWWAYIGTR
jgi:hypothetical protein